MSGTSANLDFVLAELASLGVRAEAYLRDEEGNPGVVAIGRDRNVGRTRIFTAEGWALEDPDDALQWASIVATLARGVVA